MKQRKEITTKNKKVVTFIIYAYDYDLCNSFYLFTMRSVNSNVKLLQYSKIM